MSDKCRVCGLTESEHHRFFPGRPDGCRCDPDDWGLHVAPICETYKASDFPGSVMCAVCEHDEACHRSTSD